MTPSTSPPARCESFLYGALRGVDRALIDAVG